MGTRSVQALFLLLIVTAAAQVNAGYWYSSGGEVWRNSPGECWHTGYWAPEMAIVGCDGKVAMQSEPVAEPAPAPRAAPPPVAVTTRDATVNFGFDSADLDRQAKAAIDTLVREAGDSNAISGVRLTGHTDRIGTEAYNLDLSLRRAGAVSDYLSDQHGINRQAIEIGGKGESQPLVGCEGVFGAAAIECLAPNRRVDVILDLMGR